jgi:hypothetical protein
MPLDKFSAESLTIHPVGLGEIAKTSQDQGREPDTNAKDVQQLGGGYADPFFLSELHREAEHLPKEVRDAR